MWGILKDAEVFNKIEPFFQDEHQCLATKLNYRPVPSFIKVIPDWVSCNSSMTCLCLSGGTSNPTAPQNASILNTYCSSSFLLKNGSNSAVHVLSHPIKIVSNLSHHWVSASSFLYICWALIGPLSGL